jgi:hypothetical protein
MKTSATVPPFSTWEKAAGDSPVHYNHNHNHNSIIPPQNLTVAYEGEIDMEATTQRMPS